MNRLHCVLALAALVAWSASAAGNTRPPDPDGQGLRVIAVEGPRLVPSDLTYVRSANGLELRGRVTKRYDHHGRILGHVEVDLLDAQGALLARHSGALHHFSPQRKNPDWASFQIVIEDVPADVAAIRVQHVFGTRP